MGKNFRGKTPWDETLLVYLQGRGPHLEDIDSMSGCCATFSSDCISLNIHFLVYRWLTYMVLICLSSPGRLVFTFQVLVLAIHPLTAEPPGQRLCLFLGLETKPEFQRLYPPAIMSQGQGFLAIFSAVPELKPH